jgi:hypothetical protein
MALSSVPTSMLDLTVALRALELLLSNPQMMPATPSSSSMVTTGKAACLKSAKTALRVLDQASAAVEASVVVEASEAASEVAADLAAVEASEEAASAAVVALVADMVEVLVVDMMLAPLLLLPTRSPTSRHLERREARPFMFATYVSSLPYMTLPANQSSSFPGLPAMMI